MPIRKELKKFYRPPEWTATRQAILERAGFRCEDCGQRQGKRYWNVKRRCWVVVQLGVAHLDNDPRNNADANLKALCRACHLQRDAPFHKLTRQERRDRARPLLAGM
jgi:5-methylcytosine-specific restriction endonuclease McrA